MNNKISDPLSIHAHRLGKGGHCTVCNKLISNKYETIWTYTSLNELDKKILERDIKDVREYIIQKEIFFDHQ